MRCSQLLKKWRPDMLMTAHMGAIPIEGRDIDTFYAWSEKLLPTFTDLLAREDPNFGTDANWVSFFPYRVLQEEGGSFYAEVRVQPVIPSGWGVDPGAKKMSAAKFAFSIPVERALTAAGDACGPKKGKPQVGSDMGWPVLAGEGLDESWGEILPEPLIHGSAKSHNFTDYLCEADPPEGGKLSVRRKADLPVLAEKTEKEPVLNLAAARFITP
jgi:hypothetical protein